MRSFVAAWGIKQMVQSMTKQNTSSSDNVFGYGLLAVRDQANPETCLPQMRLPVRTRSPKLDVAMTQGKKGLFAFVAIDRNEVLIDLNGENYFLSPTRKSLQIGETRHVFGRDETVGYLNHSCEPNSFLDFSCLCVRALRDIQRGEEVKVNYAATEYEMHDIFRCDCGSSACLQMIRGFKFLTRDQQLELKPYLAPYLLKKLDEEISQDRHLIEKSGLESALVKDHPDGPAQ
jgi:SET domain-containing protein